MRDRGTTTMKRPIPVAYFTDAPWVGGAEKYLFLIASHLCRADFSPTIIVNRNPRLDQLKEWCAEARIPTRDVSLNLPHSLAGVSDFMGVLRSVSPAILHCNLPGPWDSQCSLVAPVARLAGIRHVVSTEHLPMVPSFTWGRILKGFGTWWIDRVITVSEDNVAYLTRNHGVPRRKISVIRIGIPEPGPRADVDLRAELGISKDEFLCIMVGSLEQRKGHRMAFKALAALPAGIRLIVAGNGDGEKELHAAAEELGLGDRVRFLGRREDVDALLAASDALLLTSTLEATPFVIIEAMAARLPVIASRVYGIPELVLDGTTGILVNPERSDEISGAIATLARDRDLRVRMGNEGRKRYEAEFRIERCLAETETMYRALLGIDGSGDARP
jgi:glycosyltransferase involved in cell wall biosynthesis